jgi:hypothetical protein
MKRKYSRREFVISNSWIGLGSIIPITFPERGKTKKPNNVYNSSKIESIKNEIILQGRINNQAWFEPAIGMIPGDANKNPQVFIRATLLTGNDIGPQLFLKTDDLGKTWSNPVLCQNWFKVPMDDDVFEEPWFGFFYHTLSKTFLALGSTHFVQDEGKYNGGIHKNEKHYRATGLKRSIVYSIWDPVQTDFTPWKRLKLPEDLYLGIYQNGQFHENKDGSILIPGYHYGSPDEKGEQNQFSSITVIKCIFNGTDLQYLEHGSIHSIEEGRGLHEPSVVYFKGKYYMTIRHDLRGYLTTSDDGLHYSDLKIWHFDDGKELGNYNTQQKWLKHEDTLYLIYNRKSELNNGVFRSRAPLFIAEVDIEKLVVIKGTERIVFPEKGARMGNFNVVNVYDKESWVVTGEWLQGKFSHSKEGQRFWIGWEDVNYLQYIGDLLLARIYFK